MTSAQWMPSAAWASACCGSSCSVRRRPRAAGCQVCGRAWSPAEPAGSGRPAPGQVEPRIGPVRRQFPALRWKRRFCAGSRPAAAGRPETGGELSAARAATTMPAGLVASPRSTASAKISAVGPPRRLQPHRRRRRIGNVASAGAVRPDCCIRIDLGRRGAKLRPVAGQRRTAVADPVAVRKALPAARWASSASVVAVPGGRISTQVQLQSNVRVIGGDLRSVAGLFLASSPAAGMPQRRKRQRAGRRAVHESCQLQNDSVSPPASWVVTRPRPGQKLLRAIPVVIELLGHQRDGVIQPKAALKSVKGTACRSRALR